MQAPPILDTQPTWKWSCGLSSRGVKAGQLMVTNLGAQKQLFSCQTEKVAQKGGFERIIRLPKDIYLKGGVARQH